MVSVAGLAVRQRHVGSIVLLFVSLVFCVSVLPICILQIFIVHDQFVPDDLWCSTQWKSYRMLLYCFLIRSLMNYLMKFYIHLIMSAAFQKHFVQFIPCRTKDDRATSTPMKIVKEEQKRINSSTAQRRDSNDLQWVKIETVISHQIHRWSMDTSREMVHEWSW